MPQIRILAIEDDPIYAENLAMTIEDLGYLLIEVTSDINEFQRLVKTTIPDILLVDIDLGAEIDGIELANRVSEYSDAPVIFITAFKDVTTILRAKDARPSAYMTKPYEESSLQAAIEIAAIVNRPHLNSEDANSFWSKNLFFKVDGRLVKVLASEILYIEVKEKFCFIFIANEVVEVKIRLKELIDQLPMARFTQIHRSFVIALDHINEVTTGYASVIINGKEIPVGKNYKNELMDQINKIG